MAWHLGLTIVSTSLRGSSDDWAIGHPDQLAEGRFLCRLVVERAVYCMG